VKMSEAKLAEPVPRSRRWTWLEVSPATRAGTEMYPTWITQVPGLEFPASHFDLASVLGPAPTKAWATSVTTSEARPAEARPRSRKRTQPDSP
jgi:hypothetical protein